MVPEAVRRQSGFKTVRQVDLMLSPEQIGALPRMGAKQKALIEALAEGPARADALAASHGISSSVIRAAEKKNWVRLTTLREPQPAPDFDQPQITPDYALNADQRRAIKHIVPYIDAGEFKAVLLFGVSGSGKTEVFIQSMQRALDRGQEAIMLVPEIALTTQIVNRLSARFRDVAVIHSGLTGSHRSLIWSAIARGEKRVIIGTRSAVFAPCPNLGLIVVDEEQESSFKNLQAPRFHTRDVAIKRAEQERVPIVLGSATPSLETWTNCDRLDHFERIRLPDRVADLPMPRIHLVDMEAERHERGGHHLLSMLMEQKLRTVFDRGEQAVLLLNRRGYATYVQCSVCNYRLRCRNCQTSMVFHKATNTAICHYCHVSEPVTDRCPDRMCDGQLIRKGMGTQRVEEELERKFPDLRMARVDTDTMTHRTQYEAIVRDFESRHIDLIVGTQMIAKGLDFPFVSFVGVIDADTALSLPDFRAAERTFQLVTQVAGRAGRAHEQGQVVVQTVSVKAAAIQAAVDHDFERFAAAELANRKRMGYPPFTRLTRVVFADRRDSRAKQAAVVFVETVRAMAESFEGTVGCIGPNPCTIGRMRNQYRHEVVLRFESAGRMVAFLDWLRAEKRLGGKVNSFVVDVDPVSLL
jgi:primosomal protein N' (replication factor Y)